MDVDDAHCSDPIPFVSGSIPEENVKAFCDAVGFSCKWYTYED